MNAVTKRFTDTLHHPSARLIQHLTIWIVSQARDLGVLDIEVRESVRESKYANLLMKAKFAHNCGGASADIGNGNITFHRPGAYTTKVASLTFVGADSVPTESPIRPNSNYQPGDWYSHTN